MNTGLRTMLINFSSDLDGQFSIK